MKFETTKSNKKLLLFVVIIFVVILTLIISTSLAKYKVTESIKLVEGTINYSLSDLNVLAIYVKDKNSESYISVDTIPEGNYEINQDNSYCKVGDTNINATINYDSNTKALSISPITKKGTKCIIYLDEKELIGEYILANSTQGTGTPNFSKTSCTVGSNNGNNCKEATIGLYSAEDDEGISYYYRGNVENNYVKFAGYYWRIIRINGNGSLRLIYSGEVSTIDAAGKETILANGYKDSTTKYSQIQTSAFNSKTNDNTYVGFMYGTAGATTYEETHANTNPSIIKGVLDSWYTSNLANYENYIDKNSGFCGDRQWTSTSHGDGIGDSLTTHYGSYYRLRTSFLPTFKCENKERDLYTVNNSVTGNKALSNPIGLITADEVAFAGGIYDVANRGYYLYTANNYWSFSPGYYGGSTAAEWHVTNTGSLDLQDVIYTTHGVRPVINIRSNVTISGTGTIASPYEIVGTNS